MKYYKLKDSDGYWGSFTNDKIYPKYSRGDEDDAFRTVSEYVKEYKSDWEEVPEEDYVLQEIRDRKKGEIRYYMLLDQNGWPSFKKGQIYPDFIREDGSDKTVNYHVSSSFFRKDWKKVTEREYLLQEAEKRYPKGTKFYSAFSGDLYTSIGYFTVCSRGCISMDGVYVLYDYKWAKIAEPETKPKDNMKDKELKVMQSKVLEASKSCPTAKNALEILFPEAFKKEIFYKIGDKFRGKFGHEFMITQGESQGKEDTVYLINTLNGFLVGKFKVKDFFEITEEEFLDHINAYHLKKIE